jgi:hypothetical protein
LILERLRQHERHAAKPLVPPSSGKTMNTPTENDSADQPNFESGLDAIYTIDVVVAQTGVSHETILHYREQGLIYPVAENAAGQVHFDDETLRRLRRIEHLRTHCGMNVSGLKLMLGLLDEVERLQTELRSRR